MTKEISKETVLLECPCLLQWWEHTDKGISSTIMFQSSPPNRIFGDFCDDRETVNDHLRQSGMEWQAVYKIFIDRVCDIFKTVGININITPVLDVRRKETHKIIGSRSFSENPADVIRLGKLCINLYKKNKIATVVKHIPGHGMSKCDSHYRTPIIKLKKKELIKKDFKPFRVCKSLFAMTGHSIYLEYDLNNTVTHSEIIIKKIIRNHINFKGLLISDDISMKSLKYPIFLSNSNFLSNNRLNSSQLVSGSRQHA